MMVPILESGMSFGPFNKKDCFYIEKSALYTKLGEGVQIAEFAILRADSHIWLVEAKSSAPRPENKIDFPKYIQEIAQKLINSLQLLFAALLERHADTAELSAEFKAIELKTVAIKCILVINGAEISWLQPLKDALEKSLKPLIKTMALGPNSVIVLNDTQARAKQLII